MTFKTRFDGRVFNDKRKRSNSHHGSVKPETGIRMDEQTESDQAFENYKQKLEKLQKTGRYKPDDRGGWLGSYHIYNLDDIDKGKELMTEMNEIVQNKDPEKDYSVNRYFDEHTDQVKDGVLETLGRNYEILKPFLDYRLSGKHDGKHWIIAIPLPFEPKVGNTTMEDHGGFQTDAYKHKVDFASVSPETFLHSWASDLDFKSDGSKEAIAKYKKRIIEGKPVGTPFIQVDAKTGKIYQHEGRHRAQAAKELGVEKIPVEIIYDKSRDYIPESKIRLYRNGIFVKQSF